MKTPKQAFVENQIAKGNVLESVQDDISGAKTVVWEDGGVFGAVFTRLGRVSWFRFPSEAAAQKWASSTIQNLRNSEAQKIARREARRFHKTSLKEGDILASSWGYDQTNIDFFVVLKIVGKATADIQRCRGIRTYTESFAGTVVADPQNRFGEIMRVRISPKESVKIASYSTAFKWDGRPRFYSEYA